MKTITVYAAQIQGYHYLGISADKTEAIKKIIAQVYPLCEFLNAEQLRVDSCVYNVRVKGTHLTYVVPVFLTNHEVSFDE